jgi:hypothetical protein
MGILRILSACGLISIGLSKAGMFLTIIICPSRHYLMMFTNASMKKSSVTARIFELLCQCCLVSQMLMDCQLKAFLIEIESVIFDFWEPRYQSQFAITHL